MATRLYLAVCMLLFALPSCSCSHENGQRDFHNSIIYQKIVAGKKAPPGRFPYMCSLRRRGSREHVCGSTLFRRDWILTAAHCVDTRIEGSVGLSPVVHCGVHKVDEIDQDKVFDVVEGHVHPKFTGDVGDGYDIALLKLDKKAKGLTRPRLGSGNITITAGDYMAAAGWGKTESAAVAKTLRVTDRLAIVDQKHCEVPPNVTDAGSWICAGGLGEDTCKGDSGGPLLLADSPKRYIEKGDPSLDLIVGITSYGYAADESEQCSGYEPAIYTNVDYFLDWIEEVIESRSKRRGKETKELTKRRKEYELLSPYEMLAKMKSAIQADDAMDARALVLAGLEVDSSTLLHWAAANDALECTEVLIDMGARPEAAPADGETPLHVAAFLGYVEIIEVLLKAGANVDSRQKNGTTVVYKAAVNGHAAALKVLLNNGADIHIKEWNLLYNTVRSRKLDCLQILVDGGIDVNRASSTMWTALHTAANLGYADIAKVLLDGGAHVDVTQNEKTPLMFAVAKGHVDVVEVLLEAGASLRIGEWNLLYSAVRSEQLEILKILVDAGINVNLTDKNGWAALHAAANLGYADVAKILLDGGAHVDVIQNEKTPLMFAVSKGHVDVVEVTAASAYMNELHRYMDRQVLLEAGASLRIGEWNLLYSAVRSEQLEILKILVDAGIDVNLTDKNGWTALHAAANLGYADVAKILLGGGAHVDVIQNEKTPLMFAVAKGHVDVVEVLLEAGASLRIGEWNLLYNTIRSRKLDCLKILVDAGINVNLTDKNGWAALHAAANLGYADIAKVLLDGGAHVDVIQNEKTPLMFAVAKGHVDVVEVLLEAGASLRIGEWNLLYSAVRSEQLEILKILVDAGINVNLTDKNGWAALHAAANLGYADVAKILLGGGAHVDVIQNEKTPLMFAVAKGHVDVVEVLLEAGASLRIGEWNLLYSAVRSEQLEILKILVDAGIDVNLASSTMWTALHTAANLGYADIAKVLLDGGAHVDVTQNEKTPLMLAAGNGYVDVVEIFLEYKAGVNVADRSGFTSLHWASRKGHVEIVKILLAHGASKTIEGKSGKTPLDVICVSTSTCTAEIRSTLEDLLKP